MKVNVSVMMMNFVTHGLMVHISRTFE